MNPSNERRSSPGGHTVSGSLARAGFTPHASVALVETMVPRRTPHATVVCQNAWNFIPTDEFRRLMRDYPLKSRGLYRARSIVARLNTRRSRGNVVLSEYMRDLLEARDRPALLAPVTLPWELCSLDAVSAAGDGEVPIAGMATPRPPQLDRPFILVPGTLTWYKNPGYVLDLVARAPSTDRPLIVFAGADDGSGCLQATAGRADALGVEAWIGPVDRSAMSWLLVHASATVIPSRLESLSLSMAEALLLSARVAALPIPVHREVAGRMGRSPLWLPDDPAAVDLQHVLEVGDAIRPVDVSAFRRQWFALAEILGQAGGQAR